jgi:hypothetical protein
MVKRMWKLAGAAVLASGLAGGCATSYPEARTGWEFRVIKPPVIVNAPGVNAVTSAASCGLVGIDHNTAMAQVPAGMQAASVCDTQGAAVTRYAAGAVRAGAIPGGCTMEEICLRLERIEREVTARLAQQQAPQPPGNVALPMPRQ